MGHIDGLLLFLDLMGAVDADRDVEHHVAPPCAVFSPIAPPRRARPARAGPCRPRRSDARSLRLERLTPGKKLRRKGSPRSEGTSRHSYVNYCRPYRTGGLQMSSTSVSGFPVPRTGGAVGRLENGAEVSVQIASVPSGGGGTR